MTSTHPLDAPVRTSLDGAHAGFSLRHGTAARYDPEISPFLALGEAGSADDWADLAALLGPGGSGALFDPPPLPGGWLRLRTYDALQMVATAVTAVPPYAAGDPVAAPVTQLGPDDLPDVVDLVHRTEPGPFESRTPELGRYQGVRVEGRLVALAGERMHPPGWTEVSAVCTDPAYRGRGLARRVVAAVAGGIVARGEGAFLHVMSDNRAAVRSYEHVGFTVRRSLPIVVVRAPRAPRAPRGPAAGGGGSRARVPD